MPKSVLSRYLDADVLARIARQRFEPYGVVQGNLAGSHRSALSGFAVEFIGHREYVWGDDPKYIDWRVYFNRGRYVVKQYAMETNLVCHFVLDTSASMRYGEGDQQKLRYASRLVVTLGYAVLEQGDKVSLSTFDDQPRGFVPPSNALAQIVRMTEHLDNSEARGKTSMGECLAQLAGRFQRREIVIIVSDFFAQLDELESAIQRLRFAQHEVVLMQVLHHDEIAFEFRGPTKFIGLEVADELITRPEDLRPHYLAAFQAFQNRLSELCQRNKAEHVVVDTSRPLADVLADYLHFRNRARRFR